jgi:hypothetical protein
MFTEVTPTGTFTVKPSNNCCLVTPEANIAPVFDLIINGPASSPISLAIILKKGIII